MQDHDPGTLSESENLLLRAVLSGTIADLGGQTVRAEVVRSILAAKPDEQNTYAFVRIRRAVIEGGLDLEGHEIDRSILMNAVRFTGDRQRGAVILRDARIRRLSLQNCDLNGPLVADRVYLENGLFLGGGNVQGALQLRGAIVAGAVAVEGTKLGDGTSSILANGAQLTGPLMLRRARCAGQVSLSRARLKAGLLGEQIKIRSEPEMDCIVCDGANVDGDLSLEEGGMTGRFSLANVNVTGQLRLRGLGVGEAVVVADFNERISLEAAVGDQFFGVSKRNHII